MTGLAIILIAVPIALIVFPPPPPPITPLQISIETDPASSQSITFRIYNPNDRLVLFWPGSPQVMANANWPGAVLIPPIKTTKLGAKKTTEFSITSPTNVAPWRVPVLWTFEPGFREKWKMIWDNNWNAISSLKMPPGIRYSFGFIGYTNYSPEVAASRRL